MEKTYALEVKAKDRTEARKKMGKLLKNSAYFLEEKEQYNETDWHEYARESAEEIVDYLKEEIKEAKKSTKAFDNLYQEQDLIQQAHESAVGRFICNDSESIKEALDCISDLGTDFEETDSGLWENTDQSIENIINIKATYTLSNAIYHYTEEIIMNELEK